MTLCYQDIITSSEQTGLIECVSCAKGFTLAKIKDHVKYCTM